MVFFSIHLGSWWIIKKTLFFLLSLSFKETVFLAVCIAFFCMLKLLSVSNLFFSFLLHLTEWKKKCHFLPFHLLRVICFDVLAYLSASVSRSSVPICFCLNKGKKCVIIFLSSFPVQFAVCLVLALIFHSCPFLPYCFFFLWLSTQKVSSCPFALCVCGSYTTMMWPFWRHVALCRQVAVGRGRRSASVWGGSGNGRIWIPCEWSEKLEVVSLALTIFYSLEKIWVCVMISVRLASRLRVSRQGENIKVVIFCDTIFVMSFGWWCYSFSFACSYRFSMFLYD